MEVMFYFFRGLHRSLPTRVPRRETKQGNTLNVTCIAGIVKIIAIKIKKLPQREEEAVPFLETECGRRRNMVEKSRGYELERFLKEIAG